ncbi:MAG TPA: 2-dehydropantoate 2-reductase N-terminal domain-containing protein [Syntrophomonas sp.]|nr:2-dehydropantoate 2-reductase N-terminal domain-containing protein [Syntrophomonas sp.]
MKILVYGAGVLGSYLAHVLHRSGNDVTLLARGRRLSELQENGLIIRHYAQCRTTTDTIALTDRFGRDDAYDIVFVVVRRNQIDSILAELCENIASPLYVLVGNNPTADTTQRYIDEHSKTPKKVVFGFQMTGGRRENGRVISIYWGFSRLAGKMTVGSLNGDISFKPLFEQAFAQTNYSIRYCDNMDAWLKCHAAFVLPVCFACYCYDGNLKKLARNKSMLYRIIDAIDEGYRIVEACGYPVEPKEDVEFVRKHRLKCYMFLKFMAATPIGKLAASDHAMSAKDEMRRLYDDFCLLKEKTNIDTPAWDELAQYMV